MTRLSKPGVGALGAGILILLILLVLSKQPRTPRGSMAVGTLIIFIAIVLVAAIAAAVLISSGTSLQQKALITSMEAKDGISNGLEAVQVRGSDASPAGTPHRLTHMFVTARLPAGASPLSLNNTVITMDTTQSTQTINYGGNVSDSTMASGTSDYVVYYIRQGPYFEPGYVNLGDMIKIKFNIDGSIGENMRGRISIMPRSGNVNQIEFVTPETMTDPTVVIWPTN